MGRTIPQHTSSPADREQQRQPAVNIGQEEAKEKSTKSKMIKPPKAVNTNTNQQTRNQEFIRFNFQFDNNRIQVTGMDKAKTYNSIQDLLDEAKYGYDYDFDDECNGMVISARTGYVAGMIVEAEEPPRYYHVGKINGDNADNVDNTDNLGDLEANGDQQDQGDQQRSEEEQSQERDNGSGDHEEQDKHRGEGGEERERREQWRREQAQKEQEADGAEAQQNGNGNGGDEDEDRGDENNNNRNNRQRERRERERERRRRRRSASPGNGNGASGNGDSKEADDRAERMEDLLQASIQTQSTISRTLTEIANRMDGGGPPGGGPSDDDDSDNSEKDYKSYRRDRKREFNKRLEKISMDRRLEFKIDRKLGRDERNDKQRQVNQMYWYDKVRILAKKSGLLEVDQKLLVSSIADEGLTGSIKRRYQETVDSNGEFQSWDRFIDFIFTTLRIDHYGVQQIYKLVKSTKLSSKSTAGTILEPYKRKVRMLLLCEKVTSGDIMKKYRMDRKEIAEQAYFRLPAWWKAKVDPKITFEGTLYIPDRIVDLQDILDQVEQEEVDYSQKKFNEFEDSEKPLEYGKRISAIQGNRGRNRGRNRRNVRGGYRNQGNRGRNWIRNANQRGRTQQWRSGQRGFRGSRYRSQRGRSRMRGNGRSRGYNPTRGRGSRGQRGNRARGRSRGRSRGRGRGSRGRGNTNNRSNVNNNSNQNTWNYNPNDCHTCSMLGHYSNQCKDMPFDLKVKFSDRAKKERYDSFGSIYTLVHGDSRKYINYIEKLRKTNSSVEENSIMNYDIDPNKVNIVVNDKNGTNYTRTIMNVQNGNGSSSNANNSNNSNSNGNNNRNNKNNKRNDSNKRRALAALSTSTNPYTSGSRRS